VGNEREIEDRFFMAAYTTFTREPAGKSGSDTQDPPVLNVRRPSAVRAEIDQAVAKPHADLRGLDDTAQPRTVLRLPDLAAAVKRMQRPELNLAAIAQWIALGLGGLLALWLILGGRRPPVSAVDEAPPWAPPGGSQVEMAPAPAPQWQSQSPSARSAPAPSAPHASGQPSGPNTPSMPQAPDWNDPNWNDSANRAAPPAGAARQEVRTARRSETGNGPPPGPQSPQAQPLNVTVPVPQ
jgi:hypothetical protein